MAKSFRAKQIATRLAAMLAALSLTSNGAWSQIAGNQIAKPTHNASPADPKAGAAVIELRTTELAGEERVLAVQKASLALTNFKLAQGEFLQIDNAGHVVAGQFSLQRPGRMRFEYEAPSPLLLISDGANVAVQDRKLKTTDRIPLRQTPLFFILKDKVDIARDAKILNVRRTRGELAITIADKGGETEGQLTLRFSEPDYRLLEWSVLDPQGASTQVLLRNISVPSTLDPRLFVVRELQSGPRR